MGVLAQERWVNGDVLETIPKAYPFLSHYAVLVQVLGQWYVLHNNESHGVHKEELSSLLERHTLHHVHRSPLTGKSSEYLLSKFKQFEGLRYEPVSYNCETFVAEFTGQRLYSYQSIAFGVVVLLVLFIVLVFVFQKIFIWLARLK